jgi:hypothetical protein
VTGPGKSFAASDNPSITILLNAEIDQAIAGEATPSLELDTEHAVVTRNRHEVARAQGAQRGNQFYKQAGHKRLGARVELDVGP